MLNLIILIFTDDHLLEFGAHWIHGEEGNVVFDFASKNDLIETDKVLTQSGITLFVFL